MEDSLGYLIHSDSEADMGNTFVSTFMVNTEANITKWFLQVDELASV